MQEALSYVKSDEFGWLWFNGILSMQTVVIS